VPTHATSAPRRLIPADDLPPVLAQSRTGTPLARDALSKAYPLSAMEENARGPFTLIGYDNRGERLGASVVDAATDLDAAWERVLAALPAPARTFAVYDAAGALVRVGARPAETLTDDADVSAMAMDSSGAFAVTGHTDGDVRLWDLATRDPVWRQAPADEPVRGVAFVERGPWVLAWCDDGPMLLLDRATGELLTRVEDPQFGAFMIAIAPDGAEVACTGLPGRRIALPSGEALPALDADAKPASGVGAGEGESEGGGGPVPEDAITYLAYLPGDGALVGVRAAEPTEVVFWDRTTGARVASVYLEHGVAACDLSPDGALAAFVSGEEPTRVTFVDTRLRTIARAASPGGRGALDARFTPDGARLVVQDEGVGVVLVECATGAVLGRVAEDAGVRLAVPDDEAVVPEERESAPMMVTRDSDGRLELTQLVAAAPPGPLGRAVARDGALYAAVPYATDNNFAALYDLARMRGLATLPHRGNVQEIWLSPDGRRVAVRAAGHVTLWALPEAPATYAPAR
jgi:WD40 repeat protein